MELLNNAKVKELFDREAILIGSSDVVPIERVAKLFGVEAMKYGSRVTGNGFNMFGIGDYQLSYLTLRGFQLAATYHNIDIIRKGGAVN